MFFEAVEKNEVILLLCGDKTYKIEKSQYAPGGEITDVGKVLSKIIYKAYKIEPNIKEKMEEVLLDMLHQTEFDVYMVILYIVSQLFKEKNQLSPFFMNMIDILPCMKEEVEKRKEQFK